MFDLPKHTHVILPHCVLKSRAVSQLKSIAVFLVYSWPYPPNATEQTIHLEKLLQYLSFYTLSHKLNILQRRNKSQSLKSSLHFHTYVSQPTIYCNHLKTASLKNDKVVNAEVSFTKKSVKVMPN